MRARRRRVGHAANSRRHGTGTLSILAGVHFTFTQAGYQFDDDLGGAVQARIVPVRIGNSVVQLTTSSVARGINHAVELCANEATRVQVLSMSMGGVASASWAQGRVVRSDLGWVAKATGKAATTEKEFANLASDAEWAQWAAAQAATHHVRVEELYVECIV